MYAVQNLAFTNAREASSVRTYEVVLWPDSRILSQSDAFQLANNLRHALLTFL